MDEAGRLLRGIRVVEAAEMIFVPSAATIMADFGAEVIKVEQPGRGDQNRQLHLMTGMPVSENPYSFQIDNRNKKSVVLDLKQDAGREVLRDLLADADVFLTNYRPQALVKLQLTYEDLKSLNPRMIYAYGSGFGEVGPDSARAGYDMVCYWSRSAIEGTIFPLEGWLSPIPPGTGDKPSGMTMFGAIQLALFARERDGKGRKVSTSLLANGAWANSCLIQARLCGAEFPTPLKRPREVATSYTYLYYLAGDDRALKLCIVDEEKTWPRFCRAMAREEWIEEPRFATKPERVKRMTELIACLDEAFAERDLSDWSRRLEENDVPYSSLADYDDVIADEQMEAIGVFTNVDHEKFGKFRTVDSPITVQGEQKVEPGAAPEFGQHTRETLAGLGLAEEKIQALLDSGAAYQREEEQGR